MTKNKLNKQKIKYILDMQKHSPKRKLTFGLKDLEGERYAAGDTFALEDLYQHFSQSEEPITLGFPSKVHTREFVIIGIAEDGISLKYFPIIRGNHGTEAHSIISAPKLFLNAADESKDPESGSKLIKAGLTLLPDVGIPLAGQLDETSSWNLSEVEKFNNGTTFSLYTDGNTKVTIESYKAEIVGTYVQFQPSKEKPLIKKGVNK